MAACAALSFRSAGAAYEPPNPAYDPPASYYNGATGTGTTLLNNLHGIISNMKSVTYGDARYAFAKTDADPAHAGNILLVYNNASVSGTWDAGATFNREHLWPKFWLNLTSTQVSNSYSGPASDLFELRPADPNVNSARSDYGYGFYPATSGTYSGSSSPFGTNTSGGSTYWFPSTQNAGEVARAIFYMATRYSTYQDTSTGTLATHSLTLVNGAPTARYTMGDLQSLLHWNYEYGVDNFERARNQAIYADTYINLSNGQTVGPQGNRNPFVDHPEYVWAIFGGSNNNSQISVGTPDANGASSATVDLGRIMVNGTFGTSNVTFNKTGSTPTTFDTTATGNATITVPNGGTSSTYVFLGTGQAIDYGTQTRTVVAGLNAATSTTGLKSGTITVDNTDLTTASTGQGSADGNDTINVSGAVLANRTLTVGALNPGRVMLNSSVNTTIGTLAGDPDDNNATRVNIANGTASNSNVSASYSGGAFTFNGPSQSRNLAVQFTSTGLKNNLSLNLAPILLTNGEAGGVGASVQAANLNYTVTVLDKRVVTPSQSSFNFGTVIVGGTVGGSFNLTTTGDDNNRTRVNVDGNSSSDANGIQITGTTALFNSATSTSSRDIGGSFSSAGAKSGSLSLAVTTAENGGSGLSGEGTYSSIDVGYSATVLDHANASFANPTDTNSRTINLGTFSTGSGVHQTGFNLYNLAAPSGYTASLIYSDSPGTGDTTPLTTDIASVFTAPLAAGSSLSSLASFDATNAGTFSATYTLNLADVNIPGATGQSIMLTLTGKARGATDIYWTGGTSAWDIGTTSNWTDLTSSEVYLNGDKVHFDDTAPSNHNVVLNSPVTPASVTVTNSVGNDYTISGAGYIAGASTTLTKSGTGMLTISTANTHGGGTTVDDGTLVVAHVNALGTGGLVINNAGKTVLQTGLAAPVQLPSLSINGGSSAPTAMLDIKNNNLIVHNGDIATTQAQLKTGLNSTGALWTGPGINSGTAAADAAAHSNATVFAVGAIQNIDKNGVALYSTWPGSETGASGLTTTDVLVKYTYFGDADLNGVVDNTTDYDLWSSGLIDPGLAATNGWLYGDFDYSGIVDNTTDYDLWSAAFIHQGDPQVGSALASNAVQAVPEPGAAVLGILGGVLAAAVQARKRRGARSLSPPISVSRC